MDDKVKIVILEITVIALFLSFAFVPRMYPDEGTYLNYGNAWRNGNLIPDTEIPVLHRPVFISLAFLVSNLSLPLTRLIILPFVMGSIYLAYMIGKELNIRGELTSLPLLLSPIFLIYLGTFLPDYALLFFILLSIYLLIKAIKEEYGKWSYLLGLSTSLAILTKESGALLIPIFLVFYKDFEYKKFLAASLLPLLGYIALVGSDFFLFLNYSLNYSYPIAQPSLQSFVNMFAMGLGTVLILSIIGLRKLDIKKLSGKLSLAYSFVFIMATLVLSSTWVERYAILFLPGLLVPSAVGIKEIWRKKYLAPLVIIPLLGTAMFVPSNITQAEREWGTAKYKKGLESISKYEEGEVFMQINDEQVRWLTGSNRFKKLPRTYKGFEQRTDCEDVPVFLWKYGETTIWEPGYWDGSLSKSLIEETEEGKLFKVNCTK